MKVNQLNLFFPTVVTIGKHYIKSINWESWVQNPDNQRYYLLARSYASGLNWIAKINSSDSETMGYPHRIMEYDSYQQFFQQNEIDSCVSPIKYKYTYLTAIGAIQHHIFYAQKSADGKYQNISLTKTEVRAKANPQDSTKYFPVLTLEISPFGKIVETASTMFLPNESEPTSYDSEQAIANLHLALEAMKSHSPDAAMMLQGLMVEICLQNYRDVAPEFDLILAKLIGNNAQPRSSLKVSSEQIKLLHTLFQVCKGWWNWNWENGKFKPTFEPAITSKLTVL